MEQNSKQIQLLNKIKGVPEIELIIITDPPTQDYLEGNAVDFFILYDNWVEVIFDNIIVEIIFITFYKKIINKFFCLTFLT